MNQSLSFRPRPEILWALIAAASLVSLLLLYRPYLGVVHDARIYLGYALAAADPGGVGRDLMFIEDQQARFSLYPALTRGVAAVLGYGPAAIILTLTGLIAWLAAAGALAARLARGRMLWAALVCAVVLAPNYGGLGLFGYAEPFATPRPLSEAAVMGALAALLAGRRVLAGGLLVAAALIHPIMALGGVAVAFLILAAEDRRWLWAGAAAAVAGVAAASLGAPLAERLFTGIDATWLAEIETRNIYLFIAQWTAQDWGRMAAQSAAVLIACARASAHGRTLLLAILAVALGGLVASALFVDLWPSLLIAQLQTWRAGWLLAVAGNISLALAAGALWREGGAHRLTLAVLALAWLSVGGWVAAPLAVIAVGLDRLGGRLPPRPLYLRGAVVLVSVVAALWALRLGAALADYLWIGAQAGAPVGWPQALATDLPRLTAAALAIALALLKPPRVALPAAAAATALLSLTALLAWDQRSAHRRMLETGAPPPLAGILKGAPGPILWIGGDTEAWVLAGRANWNTAFQGAGLVFSRPLAMTWANRARDLQALGLAGANALQPFHLGGAPTRPLSIPSRAGLQALCARPDAPAAVVLPGRAPPGVQAVSWRAPAPRFLGYATAGGYAWRRVGAYAVIPCATLSAQRP